MDWMIWSILLGGLLVSLVSAWLATHLLTIFAPRLGWMDEPDYRKVHQDPTPRLGGLGIFIGFATGMLFYGLAAYLLPEELARVIQMPSRYFLVGTFMVGLLGLVDDIKGIDFKQKLVFQCLIAVFMILAGYRYEVNLSWLHPGLEAFESYLTVPLTLMWIIGIINAINLIDGLDGLAGGLSLIGLITVTLCVMALGQPVEYTLFLAITGAILGFLRLNYHPASIFMGDTGSLFLGYVLSTYSLQLTDGSASVFFFFLPVLVAGVPVFDTLSSMARRKLRGHPMFYPDKDHIHHRLRYRVGLEHKMTVVTLYVIASGLGLCALWLAASPGGSGLLPLGAAAAFLTLVMYRLGYLDWKGWVASRRRSQSAHFRPALRLGSLTGKNIRWDPPRRSRSITPEFSLTNLFKR